METEQVKKEIARYNDLLRTTLISGGRNKVVLTQGVAKSDDKEEIITAAIEYNNFNEDNDPYGEHDCGFFKVNNIDYMFKIDYYDKNFEYGKDPYVNAMCNRQLTILSASEY